MLITATVTETALPNEIIAFKALKAEFSVCLKLIPETVFWHVAILYS